MQGTITEEEIKRQFNEYNIQKFTVPNNNDGEKTVSLYEFTEILLQQGQFNLFKGCHFSGIFPPQNLDKLEGGCLP